MNNKRPGKGKTFSCGKNSRLPIDVNVTRNLSNDWFMGCGSSNEAKRCHQWISKEESGPIWLLRESLFSLEPLHMSPVDEPVSPWVHMRNFSPVSEMRRPKTSCGAKFGKQNKHDETQSYNFRACYSFGNSESCITVVKWDAYDEENTAAKQDNAEFIRRPHTGNRVELLKWPHSQPACQDPCWKDRDLGNQASPPSHMNTSKILQRIRGKVRSRKPGKLM